MDVRTSDCKMLTGALTRWRRAQPHNWKRNVAKRIKLEAKRPKMACTNCRWNCVERFSEEDRTELCATYNGLESYARKKDFLLCNITMEKKERERIRAGSHNRKKDRSVSLVYHFMKDGTRHRVCTKFFTGTLAIGHSPIKLKQLEAAVKRDNLRGKTSVENRELPTKPQSLI